MDINPNITNIVINPSVCPHHKMLYQIAGLNSNNVLNKYFFRHNIYTASIVSRKILGNL